jgi:hypothetical protein
MEISVYIDIVISILGILHPSECKIICLQEICQGLTSPMYLPEYSVLFFCCSTCLSCFETKFKFKKKIGEWEILVREGAKIYFLLDLMEQKSFGKAMRSISNTRNAAQTRNEEINHL